MKNKNVINITVQYFTGCPNSSELIERVKSAITDFGDRVTYEEVLVEDNQTAERVRFRGSPTLLINGKDFEDMPPPDSPALNCRLYRDGLPTADNIRKQIEMNYFV